MWMQTESSPVSPKMLNHPTIPPTVNGGWTPTLSSHPTVTVKPEFASPTQNAKVQAVLNRVSMTKRLVIHRQQIHTASRCVIQAQPIVSNDLSQDVNDKKPFDGDVSKLFV